MVCFLSTMSVLGLYFLNITRYCYFDFIIILISPLKDKSEVDVERIKATLMLCYGYVALFSPVSLIVSRMEATILRSITPHFVNVKVSCNTQWILFLVILKMIFWHLELCMGFIGRNSTDVYTFEINLHGFSWLMYKQLLYLMNIKQATLKTHVGET